MPSSLLLTPLLALLPIGGAIAGCPTNWQEYNSFCYWRSSFATSWPNADSACSAVDPSARLASIHSFVESAWVMETYEYADTWLGLNDIKQEGEFEWVDGSAVDYTLWADKQPDNYHDQDCVHMPYEEDPHSGQWDDEHCELELHFLCKKPAQPSGARG